MTDIQTATTNSYLPFHWPQMNEKERLQYHKDLGDRLLEHRYRYYALDNPVLEDWIYDYVERTYKAISRELNLKDSAIDMVDWDITKPGAVEAANRVELGQDHYTVNLNALKQVWDVLGPPRYVRKSEAK